MEVGRDRPDADPGRIAAQVVSGIGFLGAGAILRFGMSVKGLTTAACLWTSAGIGLAAGMGYWKGAAAATAMVLVTIFLFDKIERVFLVGRAMKRFVIHARDSTGLLGRVETLLNGRGLEVRQVGVHKDLAEHRVELTFMTDTPQGTDFDSLSKELAALEGVDRIDID